MSGRRLDDILGELEQTVARLADGTAPLDELVAAHQRALSLLEEAQSQLARLRSRADETAQLLSQ